MLVSDRNPEHEAQTQHLYPPWWTEEVSRFWGSVIDLWFPMTPLLLVMSRSIVLALQPRA